jgi:hypothetical protein
MSFVQFFKPENRLAKIVTSLGGKYVETAIADANEQLLQISDECLKEVDAALARIYPLMNGVPTGAELSALYRSVREVAGLAALCNLLDLGTAALSFCDLLDHAQDGGRLTEEHMRVYLNVFRVLRRPDLIDEKGRSSLLENLDVMVEKSAQPDDGLKTTGSDEPPGEPQSDAPLNRLRA